MQNFRCRSFYIFPGLLFGLFLTYDTDDLNRLRSLLGLIVILTCSYLFSKHPSHVSLFLSNFSLNAYLGTSKTVELELYITFLILYGHYGTACHVAIMYRVHVEFGVLLIQCESSIAIELIETYSVSSKTRCF